MNNKVIVSPSLLSGDFAQLGAECKRIEEGGAEWIHCDVMDGVFVPNITFGLKAIKDMRKCTSCKLDVHLMIVHPEKYVEQFADNGADIITFHIEATDNVRSTIQLIKNKGKLVGISIKPDTPVDVLAPYIDYIDMVLVMSVQPGFGAQKFLPFALQKVKQVRDMRSDILIQVDGGINADIAQQLIDNGANVIVAGTSVFKAPDMAVAIQQLRGNGTK